MSTYIVLATAADDPAISPSDRLYADALERRWDDFKIDGKHYLVDLPGYGYAKVSKAERDRWGKLMEDYFQSAGLIHLGVQIVDARHKPTADDVTMHDYFVQTGCPVVIVANKLDKLKAREIEPNLAQIRETLSLRDDELVIPFSAEKGTGKEQLIAAILDHLND